MSSRKECQGELPVIAPLAVTKRFDQSIAAAMAKDSRSLRCRDNRVVLGYVIRVAVRNDATLSSACGVQPQINVRQVKPVAVFNS